MMTGYRGTFVISWTQTEVDGMANAPRASLGVGASWRWTGETLRVDGPQHVLRLDGPEGEAAFRARAARKVHKIFGLTESAGRGEAAAEDDLPLIDAGFEVTDGRQSYTVTLVDLGGEAAPLLMFLDVVPPVGTELWVVSARLETGQVNRITPQPTGVICFTPGTMIRTADGATPIEALREGDRIQTKDNGLQEVRWIGSRRLTGARLYAMPDLRPVRIRAGALGDDCPDGDLLVSPGHQMLLRGAAARALFNTDEVLVAARDLVDDQKVYHDHSVTQVTYIHLMLDAHQIVFGNGVETESFHPASMSFEGMAAEDRVRLWALMPALERNAASYGDFARRALSKAEAAIMMHDTQRRVLH